MGITVRVFRWLPLLTDLCPYNALHFTKTTQLPMKLSPNESAFFFYNPGIFAQKNNNDSTVDLEGLHGNTEDINNIVYFYFPFGLLTGKMFFFINPCSYLKGCWY